MYWLQKDVDLLFDKAFPKSALRVSDITLLDSPAASEQFLKERVLPHKMIKKSAFGKKLKTTAMECIREEDVIQFMKPTLVRLYKNKKGALTFSAWLEDFKLRVQEQFYNLRLELFLKVEEPAFVFPKRVAIQHGDETVYYLRET